MFTFIMKTHIPKKCFNGAGNSAWYIAWYIATQSQAEIITVQDKGTTLTFTKLYIKYYIRASNSTVNNVRNFNNNV